MSNTVRLRHPVTGGLVLATERQAVTTYAGYEPYDEPVKPPKASKRKASK